MDLYSVWASVGIWGIILSFFAAVWIISFLLLTPDIWETIKAQVASDRIFLHILAMTAGVLWTNTTLAPYYYVQYFKRKMWEERMFQAALKVL